MPRIRQTLIAIALLPVLTLSTARADETGVRPAPSIELPFTKRIEHGYDESVSLLTPVFADAPGSLYRHYFLYTAEGITAFDAAADRKAWQSPAPCRGRPSLLWCDDRHAVFATHYELFACDLSNGERKWTVGAYPASRDNPETDPEDFPPFRFFATTNRRLVAIRDDRRATCVNPESGEVLWERTIEHKPASSPVTSGEQFIYTAYEQGRSLCCVLEAGTGHTVAAFDSGVDAAVDRFVPISEGAVVGITSGGLIAYEVPSGKQQWSASLPILPATVSVIGGGIYTGARGGRVLKLDTTSGSRSWETMLPIVASEASSLEVRNGCVVVATASRLFVLDAGDGSITQAPDTPPKARLTLAGVTDHYAICVALPDAATRRATLIACDYQAKDVTLATVSNTDLGIIRDPHAVQLLDNALVIQDSKRIIGATSDRDDHRHRQ